MKRLKEYLNSNGYTYAEDGDAVVLNDIEFYSKPDEGIDVVIQGVLVLKDTSLEKILKHIIIEK